MNYRQTRIVFMGTPEIAASLLETLLEAGFNIVGLVAQPDAPVGRQGEVVPVPTKKVALKYGVKVYQPQVIRNEFDFINEFSCDLIVTLAYGQIIPDQVLAWPKLKPVNIHGSLLPQLRGAAPIQYALIKGFEKTGFTLMEMVSKMDAGPMYATREIDILPEDDYGSLRNKISQLINREVPGLLIDFINGKLSPIQQDEKKVSLAMSIKKEQEHLNIALNCKDFLNYIRALAPTPGGYLLDGDIRVKILRARYYDEINFQSPGYVSIQNQSLILQLSDGRLVLEIVQWPGRRPLSGSDFINGHRDIDSHLWK